MARFVKLTVVYDMDDPDKTIGEEVQDWLNGCVGLADLQGHADAGFEMNPMSDEDAEEWLGLDEGMSANAQIAAAAVDDPEFYR